MKVVFFGTPDFAVPSLKALLEDSYYHVVGVVTQPDKRRGRGLQMIPSAIKQLALEHNDVTVWQPERIRHDSVAQEALQATEADFFVVVAYGQILPASILSMPRLGCINVHGSILTAVSRSRPYSMGYLQW